MATQERNKFFAIAEEVKANAQHYQSGETTVNKQEASEAIEILDQFSKGIDSITGAQAKLDNFAKTHGTNNPFFSDLLRVAEVARESAGRNPLSDYL